MTLSLEQGSAIELVSNRDNRPNRRFRGAPSSTLATGARLPAQSYVVQFSADARFLAQSAIFAALGKHLWQYQRYLQDSSLRPNVTVLTHCLKGLRAGGMGDGGVCDDPQRLAGFARSRRFLDMVELLRFGLSAYRDPKNSGERKRVSKRQPSLPEDGCPRSSFIAAPTKSQ